MRNTVAIEQCPCIRLAVYQTCCASELINGLGPASASFGKDIVHEVGCRNSLRCNFCRNLFRRSACLGQVNNGELHVTITDPSDHPVKTSFAVTSTGNQYANPLSTDASGRAAVKTLPYGLYVIRVQEPGFSPVVRTVEVRSSIPAECDIHLAIAQVATMVNVEDSGTLIDPHSSSSIMQIGSKQIEERSISLPGGRCRIW